MNNEQYEELYSSHEHLIDITIAKNFNNPYFLELHGITKEELYQSGRIGLHKAIETYDKSKGTSFQTHAINLIKWTINVEAKRESLGSSEKWTYDLANRTSFDQSVEHNGDGESITLYDLVGEEDNGYFNVEENEKIERYLSRIERRVSKRAAEIASLKLKGYSNLQIGEMLGTTHQNVSSILRTHGDKIREIIAN